MKWERSLQDYQFRYPDTDMRDRNCMIPNFKPTKYAGSKPIKSQQKLITDLNAISYDKTNTRTYFRRS